MKIDLQHRFAAAAAANADLLQAVVQLREACNRPAAAPDAPRTGPKEKP